jgi:hypothetical protein
MKKKSGKTRKEWPYDKEPKHLPSDHYYLADRGAITYDILFWKETEKGMNHRLSSKEKRNQDD